MLRRYLLFTLSSSAAMWGTVGCTADGPIVDTTAPKVTVDVLITNDTTPRLGGAVDDPAASVSLVVAGRTYPAVNNGNGTWTLPAGRISPPLDEGVHDVTVAVVDAAGNAGHDTTTDELTVDVTAPVVTIEDVRTNRRRPLLAGTLDDPTATVTVQIGTLEVGAVSGDGKGRWSLTSELDVPDGTHTATATARDPAGNSAQAANQLLVKTTPPRVTVHPLVTADTSPPLSGTIDDPTATLEVSIAGRTFHPAQNQGTWSIPAGQIQPPLERAWYDVGVTATDSVGNVGTDATTNELRVTGPPIVKTAYVARDNGSIEITFDQGVYGDAAHSTAIGLSSLRIFYNRSDDPVEDVTMTSLRSADGGDLVGADRIVVDLTLTGGPTLGLGTINIQAAEGAVWNAQGQVATRATTGDARLYDPRNLLNRYQWSFDKFMDDSPDASWRTVNGAGVLSLMHSGERSVLLADPTAVFTERSVTVPNDEPGTHFVEVLPLNTYRISTWVYVRKNGAGQAADTGIRLILGIGRSGAGPLLDGATRTVPSLDGWHLLEYTATTPANADGRAWLTVQAADLHPNDSDVYVDDFRMTHEGP